MSHKWGQNDAHNRTSGAKSSHPNGRKSHKWGQNDARDRTSSTQNQGDEN